MGASGRPRKCDPELELLWMDVKYNDNSKVISALKKHGVDSTDGEGRTAFIYAVAYDNIEIFNWALDNGANVNFQDRIGYTALHFAAERNSLKYANKLLVNGADPNIQDKHGNIALWTAMFNSQQAISDVTKLLLKHNSDVELNNNYGKNCRFMYQTFFNGDISKVDISDV
jgi:ankyrin repeat protein